MEKLGLIPTTNYITFFHPFCASGGGGERVLWTAVQAILENSTDHCLIYSCNHHASIETFDIVKNQFGINVDKSRIKLLPLKTWKFLEAKRYKRLTLILSCLGSIIPGWEAVRVYRPNILVKQ